MADDRVTADVIDADTAVLLPTSLGIKTPEYCAIMAKDNGARVRTLFSCRYGSVEARIAGPRLGFRWRQIEYFRWERSHKPDAAWIKSPADRECDQNDLLRCVRAVLEWLKQDSSVGSAPDQKSASRRHLSE